MAHSGYLRLQGTYDNVPPPSQQQQQQIYQPVVGISAEPVRSPNNNNNNNNNDEKTQTESQYNIKPKIYRKMDLTGSYATMYVGGVENRNTSDPFSKIIDGDDFIIKKPSNDPTSQLMFKNEILAYEYIMSIPELRALFPKVIEIKDQSLKLEKIKAPTMKKANKYYHEISVQLKENISIMRLYHFRHNDLNPGNIFVLENGQLKFVDCGLSIFPESIAHLVKMLTPYSILEGVNLNNEAFIDILAAKNNLDIINADEYDIRRFLDFEVEAVVNQDDAELAKINHHHHDDDNDDDINQRNYCCCNCFGQKSSGANIKPIRLVSRSSEQPSFKRTLTLNDGDKYDIGINTISPSNLRTRRLLDKEKNVRAIKFIDELLLLNKDRSRIEADESRMHAKLHELMDLLLADEGNVLTNEFESVIIHTINNVLVKLNLTYPSSKAEHGIGDALMNAHNINRQMFNLETSPNYCEPRQKTFRKVQLLLELHYRLGKLRYTNGFGRFEEVFVKEMLNNRIKIDTSIKRLWHQIQRCIVVFKHRMKVLLALIDLDLEREKKNYDTKVQVFTSFLFLTAVILVQIFLQVEIDPI